MDACHYAFAQERRMHTKSEPNVNYELRVKMVGHGRFISPNDGSVLVGDADSGVPVWETSVPSP